MKILLLSLALASLFTVLGAPGCGGSQVQPDLTAGQACDPQNDLCSAELYCETTDKGSTCQGSE